MKSSKNIILRFSIFAIILLLIIPLWFAFSLNIYYIWAIRASFLFLKLFKLATISALLLLFIIWPKIKKFNKWNFNWKQTVMFGVLTLLFFFASFYTQQDMSQIVTEDITIKDKTLNFDGNRFLAFNILSDTYHALERPFIGSDEYDFVFMKKTITLSEIENKQFFVKWYGFWRDINENGELDSDISIFMLVNNNSFDITNQYDSLLPNEISELTLEISNNILQNNNELILQAKSDKESNDDIIIVSQDVYVEGNSFITSDLGINWYGKQEEFLWYIVSDNNFFYSLLFKLGFIFRILGITSLFIAVFGLNFSKFIITKSYKELIFSTIFAYWVYWFSEFIKIKWEFFSGIVAKSLFWLFKISGFRAFINLNADVPTIGIPGFIAGIYDVCSGTESIGLFTLAYFMLIVFHWNRIIKWKALLMFIPGIIGVFTLNILRVYVLILLGAKLSSDFAINAFHTNASMVFVIIFFIIYFPFVLRIISKK